jgi:hypothetical protein
LEDLRYIPLLPRPPSPLRRVWNAICKTVRRVKEVFVPPNNDPYYPLVEYNVYDNDKNVEV